MTETSYAIALMEAAESHEEQAAIQSKYPTDSVFRDVLTLTYDPYEQFGTPLGLEEPDPIVDIEEIDEALDADWFEIAQALRTGVRYKQAIEKWGSHAAWPVVLRVLQKHFTGVSFATVNGVWGTIPLFDAGDVGDGEVQYPCVAVPVYSRHRRLIVVRPVTYLPESRARIDIFDRAGQCQETVIGDVLPRRLRTIDWDPIFAQPSCESGIVLDGWVNDAQNTFYPFDCVPLAQFREQKMTGSYIARVGFFSGLLNQPHEGLALGGSVGTMLLLGNVNCWGPWKETLTKETEGRGVIGVDTQAPYPYRPTHAWRWLVRP